VASALSALHRGFVARRAPWRGNARISVSAGAASGNRGRTPAWFMAKRHRAINAYPRRLALYHRAYLLAHP